MNSTACWASGVIRLDDILRYPASRHVRRENPPSFAAYGSYKPFLRREFSRTCVYCRTHEVLVGVPGFVVEHYFSKKFYPKLETHSAAQLT